MTSDIRWSLHLLPSCVDELLQRVDRAPVPDDSDILLARRVHTSYRIRRCAFSAQVVAARSLHALYCVERAHARKEIGSSQTAQAEPALKNAVVRFLGMDRDAQMRVLDKFQHPVYKFTPPPKVRGGLQQLDQQWPADAAFEAGSSTEASDWAGSSENELVLWAQITFSELTSALHAPNGEGGGFAWKLLPTLPERPGPQGHLQFPYEEPLTWNGTSCILPASLEDCSSCCHPTCSTTTQPLLTATPVSLSPRTTTL
ncbi:unnamed protein product [Symbiodinium sp. CCMP2592]|nr:unnamed protein product [Symbiodinium sp. CCMP2592]